jgi:BirA family transcriptional regulator, biotin operon repressor / biotin---[acetyl-CoA-carboxylase] ligase
MTIEEIRNGLQTQTIGQTIQLHAEIESTNDLALQRGIDGAAEGTLILAEHQTAGRGRRNRKWYAPPGSNLLASLILHHRLLASQLGLPNLIGAVSIATAIRTVTDLPAMLKWPNDILIHGKKVSGVLTELEYDRHRQPFMVMGFGVNVNTSSLDFPVEFHRTATSLRIESGREISRVVLLQTILQQIEDNYQNLKGGKTASIIERANRLLARRGQWLRYEMADGHFDGMVEQIDLDGGLILRDPFGRLRKFLSEDVV